MLIELIEYLLYSFLLKFLKSRDLSFSNWSPYNATMFKLTGVPQGSILGLLLFVLFMNDIHESIDAETNIELYADDTKIWCEIKSESDCDFL